MKTGIVILIVALLIIIGWVLFGGGKTSLPTSTASETVVEISAAGFSPASVTVKQGTAVKFINKDSKPHWPASGVHPTHQICPGFDALHSLKTGESYSFTFSVKKECPMHDHLNPTTRGKIIVE